MLSHGRREGTLPQLLAEGLTPPGWDISREPGNQVPTKSSDSHEVFAAFHAVLAQILLQGPYILSFEEILPITQVRAMNTSLLVRDLLLLL